MDLDENFKLKRENEILTDERLRKNQKKSVFNNCEKRTFLTGNGATDRCTLLSHNLRNKSMPSCRLAPY